MITNATLLRLDAATALATGQRVFTNGSAISVECFVDEIANSEKWTLGAKIKDATHVVFMDKDAWLAAGLSAGGPVLGQRWVLLEDDGTNLAGPLPPEAAIHSACSSSSSSSSSSSGSCVVVWRRRLAVPVPRVEPPSARRVVERADYGRRLVRCR